MMRNVKREESDMGNPRYIFLAGVASAMLLATACGAQQTQPTDSVVQPAAGANGQAGIGASTSPGAASRGTTGTTTGAAAGTAAGAGGASAKGAGQLAVRSDAKLGSIVTDTAGMTLYRFDKDKATLGEKSACNGDCAKTWPPVPADATASADLNPDLIGQITRDDGSKQLTLAGWPMYRYVKDTAAGQTNGQGVGGTWAASTSDAKKAGADRPAISVADDPKLGKILTDRNGKTLYLFTKDTPWPMKTACDAKCLKKWTPSEPITTADAEAAGLDYKLFLRFETPNGTEQNSFNCWPLYTFKGDKEPGQTNGQGVGGVWFAVKGEGVADDRGQTVPAAKGETGRTEPSGSSSSAESSSSASGTSYGY
jgi:predicted lipoprotein with Yx(FWY)xxD motif